MSDTPKSLPFNPQTGRYDWEGSVEKILPKAMFKYMDDYSGGEWLGLDNYIILANDWTDMQAVNAKKPGTFSL